MGRWLAVGAAAGVLLLVGVVSLVRLVASQAVHSGPDVVLAPTSGQSGYVQPGERLEQLLRAQGEALLRGDEQGWLAPLDPDDAQLREAYRSQFRTLRALRVSSWQARPVVRPLLKRGEETSTDVTVAYCLAVPKCPPARFVGPEAPQLTQELTVRWGPDEQTVTITGSRAAERDRYGSRPLPWEDGGLTVREGRRVIVAAAPGETERLAEAVSAGDQAASVVDRYGRLAGREVPERYIVFLAGAREWRTWRGGTAPEWAAAYAYGAGKTPSNVVVQMAEMRDRAGLLGTLRHEFGHVITVPGTDDILGSIHQWLVEGIAEYIQWGGKPPARAQLTEVRAHLRGGQWRGSIQLPRLASTSSDAEARVFYLMNHLTMTCVADRHGEAKLFRWWYAMVSEGSANYEPATRESLGESFAALDRACVSHLRRAVG
ncbi:hypothetical protein [Plantactinospora sp. BC1]|uniref:hypothetical protein n=1 Tax=Plantactinospora sp. BC1 TaxID=2108470 RepID=UPI00131F078F|nr:hypothetical protein [Plantactinospora sp. BC1]